MNKKYLEWLHKVTIKSNEKNIAIPTMLNSLVQRCYKEKMSPGQTVDYIIDYCRKNKIQLIETINTPIGRITTNNPETFKKLFEDKNRIK